MTLPTHLSDRELAKFVEYLGETYVRVKGAFDAIPSGLRTALKITTMNVTDVAAPIPATAITARNAMAVHNLSTTDSIYVGNSDVVAGDATGTTSGWDILPGESFNLDITDAITLYAVAATGKTVKIKILELS